MSEINIAIGEHIRSFRKARGMTLEQLAAVICKSKATLSKYEKGEITLDIETMYDIADALHIHVEQLLCAHPERAEVRPLAGGTGFFRDLQHFYSYVYDGRSNQVIRCVFDVLADAGDGRYKIVMYMNFADYNNYRQCENSYWGYIEHFHAITNIELTNQDSPMEKASAQILAAYLDAPTKWGLFNGFSTRPMMPIAVKMLFSKMRLREDEDLIRQLKVNKEDIRLFKLYNMMSVT